MHEMMASWSWTERTNEEMSSIPMCGVSNPQLLEREKMDGLCSSLFVVLSRSAPASFNSDDVSRETRAFPIAGYIAGFFCVDVDIWPGAEQSLLKVGITSPFKEREAGA